MKRRRVHKASVRASETSQKTLCRQEMDRVRRAGKRATETPAAISQYHNLFCNTLNEYLFISIYLLEGWASHTLPHSTFLMTKSNTYYLLPGPECHMRVVAQLRLNAQGPPRVLHFSAC